MAYRIEYGERTQAEHNGWSIRRLLLTFLFFFMFFQLADTFWPEGRELLRLLVIPGNPEQTIRAAEVFAAELESGFSPWDAVRNFCISVSGYGGTG